MGELRVLGSEGDIRIIWDTANDDEVEAARNTFEELKEKGYFAYAVRKNGKKGRIIHEFDPDEMDRIIMALPMQGG